MMERIINKLDSYYKKLDYLSAKRLLLYNISELSDEPYALCILNSELLGIARKLNDEELARKSLRQLDFVLNKVNLNVDTQIKIFVNMGTTSSFISENAEQYFKKAEMLISQCQDTYLLSTFYNNYGTFILKKDAQHAKKLFQKAIDFLINTKYCLDLAVTYTNIVDAMYELNPFDDQIDEILNAAYSILITHHDDLSYHAFVLSKVINAFAKYGLFIQKAQLEERRELLCHLIQKY